MTLTGEDNEGKEAAAAGAADAARADRESILAAYQETMREFLEAQARVVAAFLSGAPSCVSDESGPQVPSTRPVPRLRRLSSRRSVAQSRPANSAQAGVAAPADRDHRHAPGVTSRPNPVLRPPPGAKHEQRAHADDRDGAARAVVEERTGYPQDMLGLDQALEADLGSTQSSAWNRRAAREAAAAAEPLADSPTRRVPVSRRHSAA
jgi:hypothetical protein